MRMKNMKTIKFKGQRVDTKEWVHGYYIKSLDSSNLRCTPPYIIKDYIITEFTPQSFIHDEVFEVIPETVGQLRYTSPDGTEYYDGDIYKHAGYGEETVSDLCELQLALIHGNNDDIGPIIGNIHTKKP